MNAAESTNATLASLASADDYGPDEIAPRGSPILQARTLRLRISTSPPPAVPEVSSSPTLPSTQSGRRSSNRRRKVKPSRGDAVLIHFMGGGKNPDIAAAAGSFEFSDSDEDEDDDDDDDEANDSEDEVEDDNEGRRSCSAPEEKVDGDGPANSIHEDGDGDGNEHGGYNAGYSYNDHDDHHRAVRGPEAEGSGHTLPQSARQEQQQQQQQQQKQKVARPKVTLAQSRSQGQAPSSSDRYRKSPEATTTTTKKRARKDRGTAGAGAEKAASLVAPNVTMSLDEVDPPPPPPPLPPSSPPSQLRRQPSPANGVSVSANRAIAALALKNMSRPETASDRSDGVKETGPSVQLPTIAAHGSVEEGDDSQLKPTGLDIPSLKQQRRSLASPHHNPPSHVNSGGQQQYYASASASTPFPLDSSARSIAEQMQLLTPASAATPRDTAPSSAAAFLAFVPPRDNRSAAGTAGPNSLATPASSAYSSNEYPSPFSPTNRSGGAVSSPTSQAEPFSTQGHADHTHHGLQAPPPRPLAGVSSLAPLPPMQQQYSLPLPSGANGVSVAPVAADATFAADVRAPAAHTAPPASATANGDSSIANGTRQHHNKHLPSLWQQLPEMMPPPEPSPTSPDDRSPAFSRASPGLPRLSSVPRHRSPSLSPNDVYHTHGRELVSPNGSLHNDGVDSLSRHNPQYSLPPINGGNAVVANGSHNGNYAANLQLTAEYDDSGIDALASPHRSVSAMVRSAPGPMSPEHLRHPVLSPGASSTPLPALVSPNSAYSHYSYHPQHQPNHNNREVNPDGSLAPYQQHQHQHQQKHSQKVIPSSSSSASLPPLPPPLPRPLPLPPPSSLLHNLQPSSSPTEPERLQHPSSSGPLSSPPAAQAAQASETGTFRCLEPGCKAAPFQTQYLLNSHANVHSSARPHYCPVPGCPRSKNGQGFKRKNEMIRHGLVHASPGYVCPFCPDREHKYPRPDNLQRHVRVHHKDKKKDDPLLRDVLSQRQDGGNRGRRRRLLSN
ncbi:Zinc finger, C2H2-type/integrase, DNA-binding protein [Niveomyces insectorum RCEF 264]|uniref:Zinc finger, C2H2-type/integrase, DNA-binding protein n=1 Tax=Niveomyces insectorum RCEF 264 TaxID=1081102 RepID=A0A167RE80_9HYPO|nr:Zinc finger, C2H2-type/integrase, DNA-binding protein [Niveomyces insectorum RCEF 264]